MRSCPTPFKTAHTTERKARKEMASALRRNKKQELRVYPCECGAWHVTGASRNLPVRRAA